MDFPINFLLTVWQDLFNHLIQFIWGLSPSPIVTAPGSSPDVWQEIQAALDQFYDLMWPMVTAMAGVGTATMIILEIWKTWPFCFWKNFQTSHEKFFEDQVNTWITTQIDTGLGKEFPYPDPKDPEKYTSWALENLIRLSGGGESRGFFSLSTKDLIQRLKNLTQFVLDHNEKFPVLFLCLAALADREDVVTIHPIIKDQVEKKRVKHFMDQSIDGLQFKLEREWEFWNKMRVFWLNFGFVLIALLLNSISNEEWPDLHTILLYILVAVLGGFIAPIAKNLVTKFGELKNRPI